MAALILCLGACTAEQDAPETEPDAEIEEESTESPSPTGLAVEIVLPAATQLGTPVADEWLDMTILERELRPDVGSLRTHVPADEAFVVDLVLTLADRGADVVCALGADGVEAIETAVGLHPELDYCAAPVADADAVPAGVYGVEIRGTELGHVLGVAARELAAGDTVGLVLGGRPSLTPGFREGLLAGLAGADVVEPAEHEFDAVVGVEAVLEAGAGVIVVDAGEGAREAVAEVDGRALVLAPEAIATEGEAAIPAVSWRVRWEEVVLAPVLRGLGEGSPVAHSVGFAEEAFTVEVTTGPPGLNALVRGVIDELAAGERDPMVGAPEAPSTGPEGSDGDGSTGANEPPEADGTDPPGESPEPDAADAATGAGQPDAGTADAG